MSDQNNLDALKDTGDNKQMDSDVLSVSSDEYIDDETTIAAEEDMEPEIDPNDEIRLLAEDLNIDVQELCSGSSYARRRGARLAPCSPSREPEPKIPSPPSTSSLEVLTAAEAKAEQESELKNFYLSKVAQSVQRFSSDEEDDEYIPLKQIFSEIRVGSEFQAEVKDSLSDGVLEADDELMWKPPMSLTDSELIAYEDAAKKMIQNQSRGGTEPSQVIRDSDNSLALKCLMEAGYVVNDALQILRSELMSTIILPMSANAHDDLNIINKTVIHLKNDCEEKNSINKNPLNH